MNHTTRIVASTFGVLAGLVGIEHAIGEVLQGSVAPSGIVIKSWPDSALFAVLDGEPAMTLVPNLLVSGILTILFSLIFLVWATVLVERKNAGLTLILLSIIMLLVGGGFGPPLLGIIVGTVATRIHAPLTWWRARLSAGTRGFLAVLWPWSLAASLTAWLMLFPGSLLVAAFFDVNELLVVPMLFFLAVGLLLLTIIAAFAYDLQRQAIAYPTPLRSG